MIQATENVYVETGLFACNLGLITTEEGNILIDTPMRPTDALKWREVVVKKGEIRYLVNTEEHPDHTTGSSFLPGLLVTHNKTRETLAKMPMEQVQMIVKHIDPEGASLMEGSEFRLADITFEESLNLFIGGLTVKLFHLPGHSDGGIGVYIPEEKVVFTTDIIFHRKKSWLHESTPSKWIESLNKVRELDVDIIIPGHGDICKKDYLDEQAGIIQGWIDAVKSVIEKGLNQEEAFAEISIPDPHPKQTDTPMTEEELNKAIIARLYSIYSK